MTKVTDFCLVCYISTSWSNLLFELNIQREHNSSPHPTPTFAAVFCLLSVRIYPIIRRLIFILNFYKKNYLVSNYCWLMMDNNMTIFMFQEYWSLGIMRAPKDNHRYWVLVIHTPLILRSKLIKHHWWVAFWWIFTALKIHVVYHTPFLSDKSLLPVLPIIIILISLPSSSKRSVSMAMFSKWVFSRTYSQCLSICFSSLAMLEFLETMNSIGIKIVFFWRSLHSTFLLQSLTLLLYIIIFKTENLYIVWMYNIDGSWGSAWNIITRNCSLLILDWSHLCYCHRTW